MSWNAFDGGIPSEVGLMTKLKEVGFSSAVFSGSIPEELLLNLSLLNGLLLDHNQLTGTISSKCCLLCLQNLVFLSLVNTIASPLTLSLLYLL